MPPKSGKATAKKSSPRAKKETTATPSPLPAAERVDDPVVEIANAAAAATAVKEEAAPSVEEEIDPTAAVEEEKVLKSTSEEAEDDSPVTITVGKIVEEKMVVEKIVDEMTVERTEEETIVEETVAKKVLDNVGDPMAAADNGNVPEVSGEGKGAPVNVPDASGEPKEADGKENKMEVEHNDEDDEGTEEEDPEEDVEEDDSDGEEEPEEGNEQIAEEETGEDGVESTSGDDEANEEDDPALYTQAPLTERKKQKEFEIYIGGLDKGAVEEDLIEVFGVIGEIKSVRIVKHPITQKSKGFAFICYASTEHAIKALAELKDGTEVKGKTVRVSASQDNDTLYLGNICKTWNRDHVLEMLKGYGVEQIEDMNLPDDSRNEGKIKGFAFIEFKSHSDAMAAFRRLSKPDAVFGCDVSAKVSFAQAPLHPCEEDLLKVKTVYMDGIPKYWDEAKVEDICKQYGEIEKIQLSRNFTSRKRKDFGFIEFSSRDSAVACVEGINNTHLGEDVNVKADFAKPIYKGQLVKQNRGGYKVQKDGQAMEEAGKSKKKKKAKSKGIHDKRVPQPILNTLNKNMSSKSQNKGLKDTKGSQTVQSVKGKKHGRKAMDTPAVTNQQPSKKARKNHNYGKGRDRSSTNYSNPRISYSSNPNMPRPSAYAPPATSHPAHTYPRVPVSQHRHTDLEPHAGYIPPAKPVRNPYEYDARSSGAYAFNLRSSSGYVGGTAAPSSYPGYSNYAVHQGGYTYPSSGASAYHRPYY